MLSGIGWDNTGWSFEGKGCGSRGLMENQSDVHSNLAHGDPPNSLLYPRISGIFFS